MPFTLLIFEHRDTGERVFIETIAGANFESGLLSFKNLVSSLNHPKLPLDLKFENVVQSSSTKQGVTPMNLSFSWVPRHKIMTYSLAVGGWRPTLFAKGDTQFIDRMLLTHLQLTAETAHQWHALNIGRTGLKLNPLFCAMEGCHRYSPSELQFRSELEKTTALLKRTLPDSPVANHSDELAGIVYSKLVQPSADTIKIYVSFIKEVQLLLHVAPKKTTRLIRQNGVLEIAKKYKLKGTSLVLIATLALVYARSEKSLDFANKVLKFHEPKYSDEIAYKVVSDLVSLELLCSIHSVLKREAGFVTADQGLALSWCALQTHNSMDPRPDTTMAVAFNLSSELLPMATQEERDSLKKKLTQLN